MIKKSLALSGSKCIMWGNDGMAQTMNLSAIRSTEYERILL